MSLLLLTVLVVSASPGPATLGFASKNMRRGPHAGLKLLTLRLTQ